MGETRDGNETVVHTLFGWRDVPVDFRMMRRAGRWRVCDLVVDGVSIAANYRTQIERVIARSSYAELVELMEAKSAAAEATAEAALPPESR